MEKEAKSEFIHILTTGLAMFSMFFGAGNVVFPLALGQHAQDQNIFAILGLLITAVGVPFLGLMAMTLFDGDYKAFFSRMGPKTGFLIALVIMGLIGPFGAIPRCIALSFSTTQLFIPGLSIEIFSLASCIIIFLFTFKQNSIIDVLGIVLTPLLLLSLGIIIVKGIATAGVAPIAPHEPVDTFLLGLKEGYQMMDLMGAIFFSSIVIIALKKGLKKNEQGDYHAIIPTTIKASCIGAFLLSIVYIGFSYLASYNSELLALFPADQMLGRVAIEILGPSFGIVASAAVALACLTTAIALAAVSAEYIQDDLSFKKIPYLVGLVVTLVISYFVSIMNFTGIVKLLAPILEICYPALILLTILNILYKLYQVQSVKVPVFTLFALSLGGYALHFFSFWI